MRVGLASLSTKDFVLYICFLLCEIKILCHACLFCHQTEQFRPSICVASSSKKNKNLMYYSEEDI